MVSLFLKFKWIFSLSSLSESHCFENDKTGWNFSTPGKLSPLGPPFDLHSTLDQDDRALRPRQEDAQAVRDGRRGRDPRHQGKIPAFPAHFLVDNFDACVLAAHSALIPSSCRCIRASPLRPVFYAIVFEGSEFVKLASEKI